VDYSALIAKAQPRVIRSEEMNQHFVRILEDLDERWDDLTAAEKELHGLLTLLIEDFEDRTHQLRAATPTLIIMELMEANGLKQKDLVGVFETASVVSEVLSGKRELTKDHIKRLSERFHVSPAVFF
jgi:HTH-type transcriptional regulator/antitoxin HigA